jgi:hypothetical protein
MEEEKKKRRSSLEDPISFEPFLYPITLKCGHTFEKRNLYLMMSKTKLNYINCPCCRKPSTKMSIIGTEINYTIVEIVEL